MAVEDHLERTRLAVADELHEILIGKFAQITAPGETMGSEHAGDSGVLGWRSHRATLFERSQALPRDVLTTLRNALYADRTRTDHPNCRPRSLPAELRGGYGAAGSETAVIF